MTTLISPEFATLNSSTNSRMTVVFESFPTQIDGQLIVISAEATVEITVNEIEMKATENNFIIDLIIFPPIFFETLNLKYTPYKCKKTIKNLY